MCVLGKRPDETVLKLQQLLFSTLEGGKTVMFSAVIMIEKLPLVENMQSVKQCVGFYELVTSQGGLYLKRTKL